MTRHDVVVIASMFYHNTLQLEQAISTVQGKDQIAIHQLDYLCDVMDAFYWKVLRRRFPVLPIEHWRAACLKGMPPFSTKST